MVLLNATFFIGHAIQMRSKRNFLGQHFTDEKTEANQIWGGFLKHCIYFSLMLVLFQGYREAFYIMKCSFIITFFFIIIIIIIIILLFVLFIAINYGLQMLVNTFVKTSVLKVIFLLTYIVFHLNWLDLERIRHASSLCIIAKSQNLLKSLIDILLCVSGPVSSWI